jgi:hypothetical protein
VFTRAEAEARHVDSPLDLDTTSDLKAHEKEIVARINATSNGGLLFLTHPFMLLAELGVNVSERLREEIVCATPSLATVSEAPYRALRGANERQHVTVRVHGLFGGLR